MEVGETTIDPLGAISVTPDKLMSVDVSIALISRPPAVGLSVVTTIGTSDLVESKAKAPSRPV